MITESAAIDVVITTILKAASSEVVKRGINALSDRLKAAFNSKDAAEIKKVVEDENLVEPLSKIATLSLENSALVSISSPLATPEYKTKLFYDVLQLGFKASSRNRMDILLPGTFASKDNISVFSTTSCTPDLIIDGVKIDIENTYGGYYSILPASNDVEDIVGSYKEYVKDYRNENDSKYVSGPGWKGEDAMAFRISGISAGSIYPLYIHSFVGSNISITNGRIKITDYLEGLSTLIENMSDYPKLPLLSDQDILNISEIARKIQGINVAL